MVNHRLHKAAPVPRRRASKAALTRRYWRLLTAASMTLAMARLSLAIGPFRRAIHFGSVPLGGRSYAKADEIIWAITAIAKRVPFRAKCIEQGLAAQRLLRQSGIDARLHYGARQDGEGKLTAHVWVTIDRKIVLGGREAPGFTEIAAYP